ncbi:hypothetical protein D1AOALGA4SA_9055 [Olavius algarvensis Delta 1 endosymbiont]|nr:hypothetical protein D1AOALGA4SA_9055 [Olavius algarvensis Delta 1 endosymbiont]
MAQILGIGFQVSGFGCQGTEALIPLMKHWNVECRMSNDE